MEISYAITAGCLTCIYSCRWSRQRQTEHLFSVSNHVSCCNWCCEWDTDTSMCCPHMCLHLCEQAVMCLSKWVKCETASMCVIICVFWVSGSLRSIFSLGVSLSCLELIREPDYRTDTTCWCREALSSVPDMHTHKRKNNYRTLVTLSLNHTHISLSRIHHLCPVPSIRHHTHKCATSEPSATLTSAVQIK